MIVQRVTGKSLREFADEQIFEPLGMTSTHFHDDHTMMVPGRASAYSPLPEGGWKINVWNNDIVGQGGLIFTVNDLQKWDENFYTGKVGGPGFLKRQLQQGKLANGTTLSYAFGLTVGQYRGLPLVEHGGSSGGYRTIISRFPTRPHERRRVMQRERCEHDHAVACGGGCRAWREARTCRGSGAAARLRRPFAQFADHPVASSASLLKLAGRYYSPELDATYDVCGERLGAHRPASSRRSGHAQRQHSEHVHERRADVPVHA